MSYEAIILDTETTDVKNLEVIELAWRSYHLDGSEPATNLLRFKPVKAISDGACATHHILPHELDASPPAISAPGEVPTCSYWIGHNVDFDWKALGSPFVKRICTLAMCRAIWPKCESHKLTAMMYFLFGQTEATRDLVLKAHGAAADIQLCWMVLERIRAEAGITSVRALHEFSEDCRVPKIMTFGKYKDQPVSAVDKGWANWYARQDDTDPYLIEALRRARKL